MQNLDIRKKIADSRLRNWEVANKIGITDGRFSVWLRTPLREDRKKRVLDAINELIK